MENCKFCGNELPENSTVCPACGKDNTAEMPVPESGKENAAEMPVPETENTEDASQSLENEIEQTVTMIEEKRPAVKNKLLLGIIGVLWVLMIVLISLLIRQGKTTGELPEDEVSGAPAVEATIPADGEAGTITEKGSYTVADDVLAANRDNVVATCGGEELTVGQLQTYYWMQVRSFLNAYGAYAAYFGMETTQSLDTQSCGVADGVTWQQYFLESALNDWQNYQAMATAAAANGIVMDAEHQAIIDSMESDLETAAAQSGYENGLAMLADTMGAGCTVEEYRNYLETYYTGYSYYQAWKEENAPSDADIEAFFAEHEAEYADNGITKETVTIDVRHVLIMPEASEDNEVTDEAWADTEKQAKDILKKFKAGKKTEESFADLAKDHSQDPGSSSNGGLYTGVTEGQMVPEFNDWCFDTARKPGDTDIVRTDYGYHVMYFVGSTPVWQDYAKSDLENQKANDFVLNISSQYPITVDYSKLMLSDVKLG